MKRILILSISILLLTVAAFAVVKTFVTPTHATVFIAGPNQTVTISAFCSNTPCNYHWIAVLSNNNVGGLDATTGPQVHFTAGTDTGTAYIFAQETNSGSMAVSIVDVQ